MSNCTIYQPYWMPPIYLMARFLAADSLVVLDTVKIEKGAHTQAFLQRSKGLVLHSLNVLGREPDALLKCPDIQHKKLRGTLAATYGRAPNYETVMTQLEYRGVFRAVTFRDMAIASLKAMFDYLQYAPVHLQASDLYVTEEDASLRLVRLCEIMGANEYICSNDAVHKYLNEDVFDTAGIKIIPQDYVLDPYTARGTLQPIATVSFLDMAMWCRRDECLYRLGAKTW